MRPCVVCGHENGDVARFCESCGEALGAGSVEQRKTVTVVFCDLAGSTSMGESVDPERLRVLLATYFERMRAIVEGYGGTVEKFIGDAVMCVFGVPVVHEDDALRAARAAVEMRDALPELGLEGRLGVMTGEVVTGTEERLATGDAVNVAARLEQAASEGEVLVGEPTLQLVVDAVEVEAVEPLTLKGKREPVPAYRLLHVLDAPERQHDTPFVGRERELRLLAEAWQRTLVEQRCEPVTVMGEAGVGKSRLVAEALAAMNSPTVLRGRCLPYGEGITYWPVVEVLQQLDARPREEAAVAAIIRSLLGESDDQTSAEEIAWAFRKTLEQAAAEGPLVVVFHDIHWGEETFLDLIEHVALLSTGAPILLLCTTRLELSERRPTWPVTLRLEPLGDAAADELIPDWLPGELRERITRAAGGNPLFVEEMLAVAGDAKAEVVVPPTLRALLAARLDQLERAERSVLERGSIEGEIFHRGAMQALVPEETQVTSRLAALVRKQLIRPCRPQLAGEDGFRFHHLLLRDAAYDALPKAVRADLHERFASWLEQHGAALIELDELLGYHLEQAHRYRMELGMPENDELVEKARLRLTAAGRRALLRFDHAAAASLLGRAAALVPPTEIDVALEIDLVGALFEAGQGSNALQRAGALAERAATAGDQIGELCARIQSGTIRTSLEPEGETEMLATLVEQALPVFEAAGDDLALSIAYIAFGKVSNMRGQMDARLEANERALIHLRRAGVAHREEQLVYGASMGLLHGTTPVSRLCEWLDEHEAQQAGPLALREARAVALAMLGHVDEARTILCDLRAVLADRGASLQLADITALASVDVELLAGDPAAAAKYGEEGCRLLEQLGEKSLLSTAAARLAQALLALGRFEDADVWTSRAETLGASDDAYTQMLWRQARAQALAHGGEYAEAERLAREAVAICEETDHLDGQGSAYADLAEVLLLVGKPVEAADALERALDRYRRKGNLVMTKRVGDRLEELQAVTRP